MRQNFNSSQQRYEFHNIHNIFMYIIKLIVIVEDF